MPCLQQISALLSRQIGLLIILFSVAAMVVPQAFAWAVPFTSIFLAVIMFGMGVTVRIEDFKVVFSHPRALLSGCALQFTIMPALAFLLAHIFRLPPDLAAGVIIVGCCPGGTASNVITYLARGDVALSVGMTTVSTLAAPLLTPVLIYWLAGSWVEVPLAAMVLSVLKIVLLPVLAGLLIRKLADRAADQAAAFCPLVSTTGIVLIVSGIIAANASKIADSGLLVMAVVMLHSSAGMLAGRICAGLFGLGRPQTTAVAVEVGLQNSGLGVALAAAHFAASPLATLPGALFSAWQNIMGGLYAGWCRSREEK